MAEITVHHDGPVVTRRQAIAFGLAHYFDGKPCRRGHIDQRNTISCHCLACDRDRALGYYDLNRDQAIDNARRAYRRDPEAAKERTRRWRRINPERRKENEERRRAAKRGAQIGPVDIKALYESQKGRCAHCFRALGKRYHIDHIVPLALGGAHDRSNIQLLHPRCNGLKSDKDPFEFAQQHGRLL